MLTSPNPLPAPRVRELRELRRKLDCERYGDCLTHADRGKWPGFHCQDCHAYTPSLCRGDVGAYYDLLTEIFSEGEEPEEEPAPERPAYATPAEVARMLGIGFNTLWRKMKAGTIPTVRIEDRAKPMIPLSFIEGMDRKSFLRTTRTGRRKAG